MTIDNMKLWDAVCKTDPDNTKNATVRGNQLTSVAPQTQIMAATEQWGPYGIKWGWTSFKYDFTLFPQTGIIIFKGIFYFPEGEFPINSSISIYRDNAHTQPDQDFAKKVETDTLTKALSKLGFNADIFMGCFDDIKYVEERKEEVRKEKGEVDPKELKDALIDLVGEIKKITAKDTLDFLDGLMNDAHDIMGHAETIFPKIHGKILDFKKEAEIRIGSFPGDDPFGLPETDEVGP